MEYLDGTDRQTELERQALRLTHRETERQREKERIREKKGFRQPNRQTKNVWGPALRLYRRQIHLVCI